MSYGRWCSVLPRRLPLLLLLLISGHALKGLSNRHILSLRRSQLSLEPIGGGQPFRFSMTRENDGKEGGKRKIIRYDNVGDPVFEGDEPGNLVVAGFDLGFALDATSSTLLIFGLIAFNFLVLANADIPQFNLQF